MKMIRHWKVMLFSLNVLLLIGCAAGGASDTEENGPTQAVTEPTQEMMGDGDVMGTQEGMMGDTSMDTMFIDSMIPHHQMAIDMSQMALDQAEHEELRQMAQQIIDAQQAEIDQMQMWRAEWYPDLAPTGGMPMMEGMPSQQDMMLNTDESLPFDLRFIDAMIPHHQAAVMMAQQILGKAEHDEIEAMAQEIIDKQQEEIAQLQEWRAQWYPDAPQP
jgi:uncharacterized protein (DUF305 family)